MTPEDWLEIRGLFTTVRDQNAVSVALRRGTATLAAQTMRVEGMALQSRIADSAGGQQSQAMAVILGATDLDIRPGDRFTLAGVLYEVVFVQPNRRAGTQAEATAVE